MLSCHMTTIVYKMVISIKKMVCYIQQEGWALYKILVNTKGLIDFINKDYNSHEYHIPHKDIPLKQDSFILLNDKLRRGLCIEYLVIGHIASYSDIYRKEGIFGYIGNLPYRSKAIDAVGFHTRREISEIIKKYKKVIKKDKEKKVKFYKGAMRQVIKLEDLI